MAKKKRSRARAKKANPTRKRATHRRKRRRTTVANPKRRRTHRRRRSVANPRRGRRASYRKARSTRRNPSRRRVSRRRSFRRNPGGPIATALMGLAAGAAAFVLNDVVTYYVTKDMAADGQRNRKILSVLAGAGGIYLAQKRPLLGLGIAVGALLSGWGNFLMLKVLGVLPAKPAPAVGAVFNNNLAAVAYDNMGDYQLAAGTPLGAVAYDNMGDWQSMGDPVPAAPWESDSPF